MTNTPTSSTVGRLARERVERHGYTAMVIGTGECAVAGCTCGPARHPYAYSLGFSEHDHPELVTFGLQRPDVKQVMDPVFHAATNGVPLQVGRQQQHRLDSGVLISLVPVPELWVRRDPGRIGVWFDVFGGPLPPLLQLCWSDDTGNLPWDPGCDPAVAAAQPLLADDPLRAPAPPRTRGRHRRGRR